MRLSIKYKHLLHSRFNMNSFCRIRKKERLVKIRSVKKNSNNLNKAVKPTRKDLKTGLPKRTKRPRN